MNELYPIKFAPILKETIWGGNKLKELFNKDCLSGKCGESWEISGVQDNVSIVGNGFLAGNNLQELIEVYMGDLVGEKVYEKFGVEFPLLFKFIDANDILSIQVHPDDELAKQRHGAYGKTEMWYVIEAEKDSGLISGFNQKINKEVYLKHLHDNNLEEILNFEKVSPGDVFFMPAGRVHAIGKGILLAEIQQTSDITYRIYDWDRKDGNGKGRELHTDLALDAIDYSYQDEYKTNYQVVPDGITNLVVCDYFHTNFLELTRPVARDYMNIDSFVVYMCMEGRFSVEYGGNSTHVLKGETILLPAELKNIGLNPLEKSKLLEVYIK
jgi:mannose-6-phosphate isomerase